MLAGFLRDWKTTEESAFLSKTHLQILQQTLKDLERAYIKFFQKRAELPRFKKRMRGAFRYPQGFIAG